jgi:hypothetical protein
MLISVHYVILCRQSSFLWKSLICTYQHTNQLHLRCLFKIRFRRCQEYKLSLFKTPLFPTAGFDPLNLRRRYFYARGIINPCFIGCNVWFSNLEAQVVRVYIKVSKEYMYVERIGDT